MPLGGRAEHEKIDMVISSRPGVGRVRRSRERVREIIQYLKALLHCLLHTPHFVLGYDIACRWQGSTNNSQLFYTPQSLRDSPPTLVGQLFFVLLVRQLDVVISSLPRIGRVRQSRERVRGLLIIPLSHFVTAPLH